MKYYIFQKLEMVMPDQVEQLRRSQDGVVGWRYRPDQHILDLLFDSDVENEQQRLEMMEATGQQICIVLEGQHSLFHMPTHASILEEIADVACDIVENATSCNENEFNPDGYYVDAGLIVSLSELLHKLQERE
jgi:hypothetical protein